MRYLKHRDQFLVEAREIPRSESLEQFKSSVLIREVAENDLRFGDSLIGRLLYSAARLIKIGVKKNIQIPRLLEKLRQELDRMVSEAFTRDMSEKYNLLVVKILMEEIKNVCLSTETKEQKLEKLIGWDGDEGHPMWRGDDPTGSGIFGYDASTRRLTQTVDGDPPLVQGVIDTINEDLPNLKDFWGTDRNDLLDKLSDFSDELRKLTVVEPTQIGGNVAAVQQFSGRFGNAINAILQVASFRFSSNYAMFLEANEKAQANSLEQLKKIVPELSKLIEGKEKEEIVGMDLYKKFVEVFRKLSKEEVAKLKGFTPEGSEKNLYDLLTELMFGEKKETSSDTYGSTLEILKALLAINNIMVKKLEKGAAPQTPQTGQIPQTGQVQANPKGKAGLAADASGDAQSESVRHGSDGFDLIMEGQWNNQSKKVWGKIQSEWNRLGFPNILKLGGKISEIVKNAESENYKKMIVKLGEEIKKKDKPIKRIKFQKLLEAEQKQPAAPSTSQMIVELSYFLMGLKGQQLINNFGKYSQPISSFVTNYDKLVGKQVVGESVSHYRYLITEGAGGTPGPTGGTGSTGGTPTPKKVSEVWEEFWEEWDNKEVHRLTQREVAELDEMVTGGQQNLVLDLRKNPDPLIAVARIFKQAHKAYCTEKIPSGQKDGRVSNQTMRQYIYLGQGQGSVDPERAGQYGPWLVKSLWEKWTDGVMRILQDQKYREILSKIDFKVAGAEDVFNKGRKVESLMFEATDRADIGTRGDKIGAADKKPHGQILLDFMNDMLDQDRQADFDSARRALLKQYFGIVDSSKKEKEKESGSNQNKANVKRMFFAEIKNKKRFESSDEKKVFCIPCKSNRKNKDVDNKAIFCHVAKVDGDYTYIKFTLDYPNFAKKIKEAAKYRDYEFDDSIKKQNNESRYVFFGIMKTDFSDKKIRLVYREIQPNNSSLYGEPISGNYNFSIESSIKSVMNTDIPFSVLNIQDGEQKKSVIEDNIRLGNESDNSVQIADLKNMNPKPQGVTWGLWT